MNNTSPALSYKPQLDTLRAFAVIGVMTHHYLNMYSWLDFGGTGVSLFFVLSGFLITGILLNAKYAAIKMNSSRFIVLKNFVIRRVLRIFPIYYLYIVFFFIIGDPHIRDSFQWYVAYAQNFLYVMTGYTGRYTHMWSLAIEEQFYLFWPWFVLFIPRKWEARYLLTMLIGSFLFKIYLDISGQKAFIQLLPAQMDALGMGAIFAFLAANRDQEDKKYIGYFRTVEKYLPWLLTLFLILSLIIFYMRPPKSLAYFGIIYSAFAALFVYKASTGFTGRSRFIFDNPVLIYIGKISYGIYLYHTVIPKTVTLLENRLGVSIIPNPLLKWSVCMAITILVASVSWHLVEKPLNNLKRYFEYVNRLQKAKE